MKIETYLDSSLSVAILGIYRRENITTGKSNIKHNRKKQNNAVAEI